MIAKQTTAEKHSAFTRLTKTAMNKTKFCGDVHCKHSGPIPLSEFGRSAYYDRFADKSGLNRYCKASNRRRTREHRRNCKYLLFRTSVRMSVKTIEAVKNL